LLAALLTLGLRFRNGVPRSARGLPRGRAAFVVGLEALLEAEERLLGGARRRLIVEAFERRGIVLSTGRNHSEWATGPAVDSIE
jgi:hypothetical protein